MGRLDFRLGDSVAGGCRLTCTLGVAAADDAVQLAGQLGNGLGFLGVSLDETKNESAKPDCELTGADSRARIFAIATNEEIVVARKAKAYLLARA